MYQQQTGDSIIYCEGSREFDQLQSKICLDCGTQISLSFSTGSSNLPAYKCPNCGKRYVRNEKDGRLFWQID